MSRRILVLEDEETLRAGMVRALSKLPGVEVFPASTFAEALEVLDHQPPDAIFSDLDLPDRNGSELLGELERRHLRAPVTFVSAYTRELGLCIPRSQQVQVVDKPLSVERLRELACASLDRVRDSQPPPFGAADYLQIACIGRHSVLISHQASPSLPADGRIVVWRGEVWSADDTHGVGLAAFRRLVGRGGAFRAHALHGEPPPRTIEGSWEHLLLDAARVADESRPEIEVGTVGAEELDDVDFDLDEPSSNQPFELAIDAPPPSALPSYDEALDRGVSAILAHDYVGALLAFEAALSVRPGDATARANLARLAALGVAGTRTEVTG